MPDHESYAIIEVDREVFTKLAELANDEGSLNDVLRSLLELPPSQPEAGSPQAQTFHGDEPQ